MDLARGPGHSHDGRSECALAAARLADQRQSFALSERKADAIDCFDLPLARVVIDAEAIDDELVVAHRLRCRSVCFSRLNHDVYSRPDCLSSGIVAPGLRAGATAAAHHITLVAGENLQPFAPLTLQTEPVV